MIFCVGFSVDRMYCWLSGRILSIWKVVADRLSLYAQHRGGRRHEIMFDGQLQPGQSVIFILLLK